MSMSLLVAVQMRDREVELLRTSGVDEPVSASRLFSIGEHSMSYTSGKFSVDELQFIQVVPVRVLAAVACEELDLNRLAREELAQRGYDQRGVWVGFKRAREELLAWRAIGH